MRARPKNNHQTLLSQEQLKVLPVIKTTEEFLAAGNTCVIFYVRLSIKFILLII